MALDDEFIRDIAFRLRQGEAVVLRPDPAAWKAFLFQQERSASIWGCGTLLAATLGILLLFGTMGSLSLIPFTLLLLGAVYWRSRLIYRTRHLYPHGLYRYELKPDRIVRYGDTKYDIFAYHELDNIIEERYGLRMEREVAWHEWLWPRVLKERSSRLLILPGYFPSYPSYLEFLREREKARA